MNKDEEIVKLKEELELVRGQRNASNRKIEELNDIIFKQQEEIDRLKWSIVEHD